MIVKGFLEKRVVCDSKRSGTVLRLSIILLAIELISTSALLLPITDHDHRLLLF